MVVCISVWTLRILLICIIVLWFLFWWKCAHAEGMREERDRLRREAARRDSALEVARFNLRATADWRQGLLAMD